MATLPYMLSLDDDFRHFPLSGLSICDSPFYDVNHASLSAINKGADKELRKTDMEANGSVSSIGKSGFEVCMDVHTFLCWELSVKILGNYIEVEGLHEQRRDKHGLHSRRFVPRYIFTKEYDRNKVESKLSSDGILTVSAPKIQIENEVSERKIRIQEIGTPHFKVKENGDEEKAKECADGEEDAKK